MGPVAKQEYVRAIVQRYHQATRPEKSRLLDELCAICGYHRKHAITSLLAARRPRPPRRKPGRPSRYAQPAIRRVVERIWRTTAHFPCSKRLKVILPLWLGPYQQTFGHLSVPICQALARISPSTLDRL
ncbi:MAG: hypothetical protein HYZ92_01730 [Candidatus Omnitrophica bacterium]|nr:hypothetical protein [Candidatus Omnitrophota bacterium]